MSASECRLVQVNAYVCIHLIRMHSLPVYRLGLYQSWVQEPAHSLSSHLSEVHRVLKKAGGRVLLERPLSYLLPDINNSSDRAQANVPC